jgi:hypothetical protein
MISVMDARLGMESKRFGKNEHLIKDPLEPRYLVHHDFHTPLIVPAEIGVLEQYLAVHLNGGERVPDFVRQ